LTIVTFKNTLGWPVGMRTVDSRNCAAAGQQVVVAQGQTKSISFSASTATSLILSNSSCRAWWNAFDCWGQSALGLDDLVAFSEGPFWTLFWGKKSRYTNGGRLGIDRPGEFDRHH